MNYSKFTKELNIALSKEDYGKSQTLLDWYCEIYIPTGTGGAVTKGEWTMNPMSTGMKDGTICVIAHFNKPIRALAVISKNEGSTDAIPPNFRYTFQKLIEIPITGKKRRHGRRNLPEDGGEVDLVKSKKSAQHLLTSKRGGWVIWRPSIEAGIEIGNKALHLDLLLEWNNRYIKGMEQIPAPEFPRGPNVKFEQFMMKQFPTPQWRDHTTHYKKTNNKNGVKTVYVYQQSASSLLPLIPPPPTAALPPFPMHLYNEDDPTSVAFYNYYSQFTQLTPMEPNEETRPPIVNFSNVAPPPPSIFDDTEEEDEDEEEEEEGEQEEEEGEDDDEPHARTRSFSRNKTQRRKHKKTIAKPLEVKNQQVPFVDFEGMIDKALGSYNENEESVDCIIDTFPEIDGFDMVETQPQQQNVEESVII